MYCHIIHNICEWRSGTRGGGGEGGIWGGGTVPYSPKRYLSTRAQVCEIVFNVKLKRKQNSS